MNAQNSNQGGGSGSSPTLVSLAISPSFVSIAVGTTEQLSAQATFSNGTVTDVTNQSLWSIAPGFASVNNGGLLSAQMQGNTTVSASYGGQSANAPVTITPASLVSIRLFNFALNGLPAGFSINLYAFGQYSDGSSQDITPLITSWAVSSPQIAKMSGTAIVGLSPGFTQVTASLGNITSSPITVTILQGVPSALPRIAFYDLSSTPSSLLCTDTYTDETGQSQSYCGPNQTYTLPISKNLYAINAVVQNTGGALSDSASPSGDTVEQNLQNQTTPMITKSANDDSVAFYSTTAANVTYTSSDSTVLAMAILPNGTPAAQALKPGVVTLTANLNVSGIAAPNSPINNYQDNISNSFTVVVTQGALTGILLNPINNDSPLRVGTAVSLVVWGQYSDGTNAVVSSNVVYSVYCAQGNASISNPNLLFAKSATNSESNCMVKAQYGGFSSAQEFSTYLLGDVDQDGLLKETDALLLSHYLTKTATLSPQQLTAADVNLDGVVGPLDLWLVSGAILGASLPAQMGDLNDDNEVNTADTTMLQNIVQGKVTPSYQQTIVGDLNFDGFLRQDDETILSGVVAGSVKLPLAVDVYQNLGGIDLGTIVLGDVSGDGNVEADDAALVARYLNGLIALSPPQLRAGDVDQDGKVTALDLRIIEIAGVKLVTLPITIGDLNNDRTVDSTDLTILNSFLSGTTTLTAQQKYLADVNFDGAVDTTDAWIFGAITSGQVTLPLAIDVYRYMGGINSGNIVLGDVLGDGSLDPGDVTQLRQYLAGLTTFSPPQLKAADVNEDGLVGAADVVLIRMAIVNKVTLPAVLGDLNGDGQVNSADVAILNNYLAGTGTLTPAQKSMTDFNCDGLVNQTDAQLLQDAAAGNIVLPPAGSCGA